MTPSSWMRARAMDAGLLLLALLLAIPSLSLPFGRDQGLYFYVAREWVERGAIPYRDVFEQKTPGIYMLHAVCIGAFGKVAWGVRFAELVMALALGIAAAMVARGRARATPGLYGLGALATSILYFGCFDFWDTAQCELGCTLFAVASLAAARTMASPKRATLCSGVLAGVAVLFKPPGLFMVVVAFVVVVARGTDKRERARLAAMFVAAAAFPLVMVFGYLAARGALPAAVDVLVRANGYYAVHEGIHDVSDIFSGVMDGNRVADPMSSVVLTATVGAWLFARSRGDGAARARHGLVVVLGAAAYLGVILQKKFFHYHFGLVVGPGAVAVASLAISADELTGKARGSLGAAVCLSALFLSSRGFEQVWFAQSAEVVSYESGHTTRPEFLNFFRRDFVNFYPRETEATGLWLAEHSTPQDLVLVRGFETGVYFTSDRHWAGRFFWTNWLTSPTRAYAREQWLAEDASDIERLRPRYVVALSNANNPVDAESTYAALGYVRVASISPFLIMARQ